MRPPTVSLLQSMRLIHGYSKVLHPERSAWTFIGALGAIPFSVARLLWNLLVPGKQMIVLNQPGLAHKIAETKTILDHVQRGSLPPNLDIFFLTGCRTRPNLPTLFSAFDSYAKTVNPNIRLIGLGCLEWLAIVGIATRVDGEGSRLLSSSPRYREYSGFEKQTSLHYFGGPTLLRSKSKLGRLLASGNPFCLLGTRDSSTWQDRRGAARNSAQGQYDLAVNHLLELGFPVVRAGRNRNRLEMDDHPLFIDYATQREQNNDTDFEIISGCEFAIGDAFGLIDAVVLLGGKALMATYPLWPGRFISSESLFFATQRIVSPEGADVPLQDIVSFINSGGVLSPLRPAGRTDWKMVNNTPKDILSALKWFLRVKDWPASSKLGDGSQAWVARELNRANLTHIWKSNPSDWNEFAGNWWPESTRRLRS